MTQRRQAISSLVVNQRLANTPALAKDITVISEPRIAASIPERPKTPWLESNGRRKLHRLSVRQVVEPLNGSSNPHLVSCSDGCMYVLKTRDNPQGPRVLANELLAHDLARMLALPVVPCALIHVDWLTTELLRLPSADTQVPSGITELGISFGSKYLSPFFAPASATARLNNRLQKSVITCIENKRDFRGMLVFDIWTVNADRRQIICHWSMHGRLRAFLMDNGCCFCRGTWHLPDRRINHMFEDLSVYCGVSTIEDFEPWLSVLEREIDHDMLRAAVAALPREWCAGQEGDLNTLAKELDSRRKLVRSILETEYFARGRFRSVASQACD